MPKSDCENAISSIIYRPWLHRFAIVLVAATFLLVVTGGNVTSRDAGLAVPDGFMVYGHFLWTFPIDQWVGNIKHEHIHRLKGSIIGLLCIAMMVSLWLTQKQRRWLRWTGVALLVMVILQGIMGGLRVSEMSVLLAVLHGITGQLFLCLTVLVAAATGRLWIKHASSHQSPLHPASAPNPTNSKLSRLKTFSLILLGILLVQLVLGAAMRHTGSGLAIPDFPASYGRVIPPLTQSQIETAIDQLPYDQSTTYFTPAQVAVHFAHRIWAIIVLAAAGWLIVRTTRVLPDEPALRRPMQALTALIMLQVSLGALVIWTARLPDVATAHQAIGAALLAVASLISIRIHFLAPTTGNHQSRPVAAIHDSHDQLTPAILPEGQPA